MLCEFGAGISLPYRVLCCRFSCGISSLTLDIHFGCVPFIGPGFPIAGSVHILGRYAPFRPEVTVVSCNAAEMILIMEEGPHSSLYNEAFQGVGTCSGFDRRLIKTSGISTDSNRGFRFPFARYDEIDRKFAATGEEGTLPQVNRSTLDIQRHHQALLIGLEEVQS